MNLATAILLSYILGAVPFSFILGKLIKNIDLRKVGSGNIGATNLARVAGYKVGVVALILDILKGIIPVAYFSDLVTINYGLSKDTIMLLLGIISICGHNWTIFLKFRGGKGIATSLGVLIGLGIKNFLILKVLLLLATMWFTTLVLSGFVSLASILAAIFLPLFLIIFKLSSSFVIFGIVIAIFAIYRHKSNIVRLLQHKENRFNIKSKFFKSTKKPLP